MNIIINNIIHLMLVRGGELFFPLLTIPMLISALGLHAYGEYVFVQTIISYFMVFVNFGFDDIGVRLIASAKSNEERDKLAINIIYVKMFLLLTVACVYFSMVFILSVEHEIYFASFLLLIVDVFNIYWFFQGIEKLGYFSVASIFTKVIYFFCVYFFIKNPTDLPLVPVLFFITFVLGNCPALVYFFHNCLSRVYMPERRIMLYIIQEARLVFLSNVVIAVKDKMGNIIAGLFIGKEAVAVYDIINKLMLVSNQPATIVNTAFFPFFSRTNDFNKMKFVLKILILLSLVICLISIPFVWAVIPVLYNTTVDCLISIQVSFISCVLYSISFFIGRNIFVARGMMKELFVGVIATSCFYVTCLLIVGLIYERFSVLTLITISVLTYLFEMLFRIYIARNVLFKN